MDSQTQQTGYMNLLSKKRVSNASPTLRDRFIVTNTNQVQPYYKQRFRSIQPNISEPNQPTMSLEDTINSQKLKQELVKEQLSQIYPEGDIQICQIKIPRCLKISGRYEDNNIELVRKKLRQNRFFHHIFDPSLDNSEGTRYYEGVYSPVDATNQDKKDDLENAMNLYEYIVQKGLYKELHNKETITHLRTGFDPKKQKALFEKQAKLLKYRQYKQMLHQIDEQKVFLDFIERLQTMENDNILSLDPNKKNNIEKSTQMTLKKFMPTNYTSTFTVVRQKIEKLVDEGYSFKQQEKQKPEKIDKQAILQLKSPIEKIHEEKEKERMMQEELEKQMKRRQKTTGDTIIKNLSLATNLQLSTQNKKQAGSVYNSFLKDDPFMRSSPGRKQRIDNNSPSDYQSSSLQNSRTKKTLGSQQTKRKRGKDQPSRWKVEFGKIRQERLRLKQMQENGELSPQKMTSVSRSDLLTSKSMMNQGESTFRNSAKSPINVRDQSPLPQLLNHLSVEPSFRERSRSPTNSPGTEDDREFIAQLQQVQKDFISLNKDNLKSLKVKDHRPWTVQQPTFILAHRPDSVMNNTIQRAKLRSQMKENALNYTPNESIMLDYGIVKPQLAQSTRHSVEEKHRERGRRNVRTAIGSINNSTRVSFMSPSCSQGMSTDFYTRKIRPSINEKQQSQHSKYDTLSSIVNLCDTEDTNWLKNTETDRSKIMQETVRQEEEIKQAVDNYLDLLKIGVKQTPKIQDILELKKEIESYDFSNFLSPKVLKNFKEDNYKQTISLLKDMSRRKIWQPDRFHISKKTLLTFNMHNMAEMCFQHVFKRKNMPEVGANKLTNAHQQMIDEYLFKWNHDYVDNPFWSVMQIKVKFLDEEKARSVGEIDKGKVILFTNLSIEESQKEEITEQLRKLKLLTDKYGERGFCVYGALPNDVAGGNPLRNKEIANTLKIWGYFNPALTNSNLKFLQKFDVNGNEADNLFKFLRRNCSLFTPKIGKAIRVKENYSKLLCNRYGEVKKYYSPSIEFAVIEADVRKLLEEEFLEERYNKLLNPPDHYF
ncbi:glutathione peroxidase [Stylonychia lemnae]|uniref:Glutathione peroxidase n=1 Tax=Stylonychia lemnae TaxID=5949 RepID=A0A078A8P2_STYLE|nr:glutathione peroxidase [Stylonychia lemnae]|eukprot:CDW77892.1 glutathione peroxidase [Stylonychia lemnae]